MPEQQNKPAPKPQLVMRRDLTIELPEISLAPGCTLRYYQPGDGAAWEDIIADSFESEAWHGRFEEFLHKDNAFRPERVWFACRDGEPVATAAAWYRPEIGADTGYLHMVGVLATARGLGLGGQVSLACMHQLVREQRTDVILQTDDFRIPAVKTYLKLGFHPRVTHDSHPGRWAAIFKEIGREHLVQEFAADLADWPPDESQAVEPDMAPLERYATRRRWHRSRPAFGGGTGGGDMDFMGDESLYQPSRLGATTVEPAAVVAGNPLAQEVTLTFTAGPDGLPQGANVRFAVRGQNPLGIGLHANTERPGAMQVEGPPHCEVKGAGFGFEIVDGELRPGDVVCLRQTPAPERTWTPLAGRREIKTVIEVHPDEPRQRLPEPAVIGVRPRPFSRLEATVACTRAPGEDLQVHVTARDEFDNRVALEVELELSAGEESCSAHMIAGVAEARLPAPSADPVRVRVASEGGAETMANASVACADYGMYVGDLHCHDFLSEAEGCSDEVYDWARDERRLDFMCLAPQSHGGHDNDTWALAKYMNERYLREGEFVTFLGFEWQHSSYADKVVHYLGGDQPYLPVDNGRYNTPAKLYEALRRTDALVISHHVAYPRPRWVPGTDFDVIDTDIERLVEIWSMHGSSEGFDPDDRPLRAVDPDNTVLAALRRGVRLGFVGGSDTHGGRPGGGAKEPCGYWGGLAAVWAGGLTRRAVFNALRARRTCALTGARIVLKMTVNDAWMGSELPLADRARVRIDAWAAGPIKEVQLLKNGALHRTFPGSGTDEFSLEYEDTCDGPAFYHCRVVQADGHLAVCSPVWLG